MTRDTRLSADHWGAAAELFERALEVAPEDRRAWLESHCPDDGVLAMVARMLAADDAEDPVVDAGAAPFADLASAHFAADIPPGTRIDDYVVGEEIGRGGMGVVYRATDVQLERDVALKFFGGTGRSEAARARHLAEARAAARLDHPNVGAVYRVGETDDGGLYFAMPLYRGETLRERLRRGPLPPEEAGPIAREVASGLAAAHAAGIVHRDVKPENVFLPEDGPAKLLDFGVAASMGQIAGTGSGGGTTAYLSPEQVAGAEPDPRDDVWAFGLTILEALTGANPVAVGGHATTRSHVATLSAPPALPLALRPTPLGGAIGGALALDPEERLADGSAVAEVLSAGDDGPEARGGVRHWLLPLGAAAATVAAIVVLGPSGGDSPPFPGAALAEPVVLALPFDGPASDTARAYLRTNLPEEIAARLRGFGGVQVRSARGLPSDQEPAALAARVGAGFAMRGHLEGDGGVTRVRAELVSAGEGARVWSADYAVRPDALPTVERRIAADIASALGLASSPGGPADPDGPGAQTGATPGAATATMGEGERGTADPEAYEAYLRANHLLSVRTESAVREAMDAYGRAAAIDPAFAAAAVRHAYAAVLYVDWGWAHPERTHAALLEEARRVTDAAIARDSLHAEAWLTRAYLEFVEHPNALDRSIEPFRRAVALDPTNPEAHHQYGQALMALGRYDEAIRAYENTLALEPGRGMTLMAIGAVREAQGDVRAGMPWLDSAIALAPDLSYTRATRAGARVRVGDPQGALHDAERAIALNPDGIPERATLSHALRAVGRAAEADRLLEQVWREMRDADPPSSTDALYAARALTGAGRRAAALDLLQRVRPLGGFYWFYLDKAHFAASLDSAAMERLSAEAWPDASRPPPQRRRPRRRRRRTPRPR